MWYDRSVVEWWCCPFLCVDAEEIDINLQNEHFFGILHQNRVQNIIQYHDENIWKQMCIKILCYITDTYPQ